MPEQKSRLTIFQIFSYSLFGCNALFLYLGLFIFGYFLATGKIALNSSTAVVSLIYIIVPLAWVWISAGLARLRPQARIYAVALAGFSLWSIVYLSATAKDPSASFFSLWPLFTFFLAVLLVMFLPSTKEQFGLSRKDF